MNQRNNSPNNMDSVWIWVTIAMTIVIVLIFVNGPIIFNRLYSVSSTQVPHNNFQNNTPQQQQQQNDTVVDPQEDFEEQVTFAYENLEDYIDQDLSNYDFDAEMLAGSTQLYFTATFTEEQNIYWNWNWCASDEATLYQNFENISIVVTLNGVDISPLISEYDYDNFSSYCRSTELSDIDWEPGQHLLHAEIIFTAPIDDGITNDIYPAATHIREYQLSVTE